MAKVALSFGAWQPGAVEPASVAVPVDIITVAVSPQLRATLTHDGAVREVVWSPDSGTLATVAIGKGQISLWNVAERKRHAKLSCDLGAASHVLFTRGGKTLISGHSRYDAKEGLSGGIALWDIATGQRSGILQHSPPREVGRIALAHDGRSIIAAENWREGSKGPYKSVITLWDTGTKQPHTILDDGMHACLALSPDGRILAWGSYETKERKLILPSVRRRDLVTGRDLPPLQNPVPSNLLTTLAYSPDGYALAAADQRGKITIWDTETGKVRATMQQDGPPRITALAFAQDNKTLAGATAGRNHEPGSIVLWGAATGERRAVLTGHTNAVLSLAFSPDGRLLASGGSDRTVRLWDMTGNGKR